MQRPSQRINQDEEPGNGDRHLIDRVLQGLNDAEKSKILEIVYRAGVEPDDPMFLALLVLTQCQLAVTPIPGKLESLCNDTKLHLVTLQSYSGQQLQECRDVAYDIKVAANRLSKQLAVSSSQTHSSALLPFLWAFFGSVCGSAMVLLLQRVF